MAAYKLKHACLTRPFIEGATQKGQRKEHCMCIKQKQNISSQSLLRNPSTPESSFQFLCCWHSLVVQIYLVLSPPIFSCRIPPWFLFHLSPILQKLKMEWGSTNEVRRMGAYWSVLSKWEFLIKMRAALLAPILHRVMEAGESKKAALILMKTSHFDTTPQ